MTNIPLRAYALQRGRPLTLQATINLPTTKDDPSDPLALQLSNFIHQLNVFCPFDEAFTALWNNTKAEYTPSYIPTLQKQLQEVLPPYLSETQAQLAELQINQSWLKHMTWQLGMANGNGGDNPGMPYQYPIDIARDLLPMVSHLSASLGSVALQQGLGMVCHNFAPLVLSSYSHLVRSRNFSTSPVLLQSICRYSPPPGILSRLAHVNISINCSIY